jgi:LacI family transcriptional regulator, repressor for deo operon, udp, cdd, tsx, nupC, and nupG
VIACEGIDEAPFPQVQVDNYAASKAVATYLAALGHTRVGYVSGPPANILEQQRRQGFRAGLHAAGIAPESAAYFAGNFTVVSGAAAARAFLALKARPTAVHAVSDEMAIGFIKTLRAAGVTCPADVSVVGFDGIDLSEFCEPSLTTVKQPRGDIGRMAASLLIEGMTAGAGHVRVPMPAIHTLPVELLKRESCVARLTPRLTRTSRTTTE